MEVYGVSNIIFKSLYALMAYQCETSLGYLEKKNLKSSNLLLLFLFYIQDKTHA